MAHRAQKSQTTQARNETPEMKQKESPNDLLTVREVARHLRVDDTTVRRWIKCGALEAITLPHRGKRRGYRVRRTTLDELFSSGSPLPEV